MGPTAIWRGENLYAWQGLLEDDNRNESVFETPIIVLPIYILFHSAQNVSFYFPVVGYFDCTLTLPRLLIKFTLNQRMVLATT